MRILDGVCACGARRCPGIVAGLLLLIAVSAPAHGAAVVHTDNQEYPPGATVLIDGAQFLPGEYVLLRVEHVGGLVTPRDEFEGPVHLPWLVEVRPDGGFDTNWAICHEECIDCTLLLTAIGTESGAIAKTRFLRGAANALIFGACCFEGGVCLVLPELACGALGGTFQGLGTVCGPDLCDETGACCGPLPGHCSDVTQEHCESHGGVFLGDDTDCANDPCVGEPGACCIPFVGLCVQVPEAVCNFIHGSFYGEGVDCTEGICRGACCLPDDTCVDVVEIKCHHDGGEFFGIGSFCANGEDGGGGDGIECAPPEPERPHPGWNWLDQGITLTGNQPTYWSALTGRPASGGLAPFPVLDWGDPPGRPAMDGTTDRVLRGYVIVWAVNADGEEIRWNHLLGEGTILNYQNAAAWEYDTANFPVVSGVDQGAESDAFPGVLELDGAEYAWAHSELVLNFQAAGSRAWGSDEGEAPRTVEIDSDITLLPLSVDVRQNNDGPATTRADVLVWNENEVKMSGNYRCITCWDQTLISLFAIPPAIDTFSIDVLQTDHGRARIDGQQSNACNVDFNPGDGLPLGGDWRDLVSEDAALVGVAARMLIFDAALDGASYGMAGSSMIGVGEQAARIQYDVPEGAQEAQDLDTPKKILDWLDRQARTGPRSNPALHDRTSSAGAHDAQAMLGFPIPRMDTNKKGSLVIFPNVEVRWSGIPPYDVIQDTFLSLTNDADEAVEVQMYFVNGDPPLAAEEP